MRLPSVCLCLTLLVTMAEPKPSKKEVSLEPPPKAQVRPLAPSPRRATTSHNRLYEAVMRLGGEPFLAPFVAGVSSLTEHVVKKFKQRSFFSFESFERSGEGLNGGRPNKFTRFGASPFRGDHRHRAKRS